MITPLTAIGAPSWANNDSSTGSPGKKAIKMLSGSAK